MNTLKTNSVIKNINDSVMVLVDGEYKGQLMSIEALRNLVKSESKDVVWTRKVLVSGVVTEKQMTFSTEYLREFVKNNIADFVFGEMTTGEFVKSLRSK